MRNIKIFCLLTVPACMMIAGKSFSQVPQRSIEGSLGIGKVVKNYPDFPDLNQPAMSVFVNYSHQLNGSRPWHRYYGYPRFGVSITAGSLGNNDLLGYYTGVMPEMTFERRIGMNWFWAPRLSLGAGWFSDPYDEKTNPENIVIGSSITFFAGADIMLGRSCSKYFDVILKTGISHASNSHFQLPNVGLNLPYVSAGVRYKFRQEEKLDPAEPAPPMETPGKIRLHIRAALGVNEFGSSTGPANGPKYPIYLGSVYVSKMFSPVNKVTAGFEGWYSQGYYDYIVSQEFYESDPQKKSCSFALVFGHEFLMGHFGFLTTLGLYVYNPFYKDQVKAKELTDFKTQLKSYIPARLGIQYYLKNTNTHEKNNLFVGIYIKTNFGQADFLESGIGYMF